MVILALLGCPWVSDRALHERLDADADGVEWPDDCDDDDPDVHPGVPESCATHADDDCDGDRNEPDATGCTPFYADADGDGAGGEATACLCEASEGYPRSAAGDCDDGDASAFPGAPETCDGVDDDCDGNVDAFALDFEDGLDPALAVTWAGASGDAPYVEGGALVLTDDAEDHAGLVQLVPTVGGSLAVHLAFEVTYGANLDGEGLAVGFYDAATFPAQVVVGEGARMGMPLAPGYAVEFDVVGEDDDMDPTVEELTLSDTSEDPLLEVDEPNLRDVYWDYNVTDADIVVDGTTVTVSSNQIFGGDQVMTLPAPLPDSVVLIVGAATGHKHARFELLDLEVDPCP